MSVAVTALFLGEHNEGIELWILHACTLSSNAGQWLPGPHLCQCPCLTARSRHARREWPAAKKPGEAAARVLEPDTARSARRQPEGEQARRTPGNRNREPGALTCRGWWVPQCWAGPAPPLRAGRSPSACCSYQITLHTCLHAQKVPGFCEMQAPLVYLSGVHDRVLQARAVSRHATLQVLSRCTVRACAGSRQEARPAAALLVHLLVNSQAPQQGHSAPGLDQVKPEQSRSAALVKLIPGWMPGHKSSPLRAGIPTGRCRTRQQGPPHQTASAQAPGGGPPARPAAARQLHAGRRLPPAHCPQSTDALSHQHLAGSALQVKKVALQDSIKTLEHIAMLKRNLCLNQRTCRS